MVTVGVFIIVVVYPYETTMVPAWKIRVVDCNGVPVKGEFVRESWKHYSLDADAADNSEAQWSD